MPDGPNDVAHRTTGSALQKAVSVLGVLVRADQPLGLAEVADRLDLPRQTVHRVVGQLEAEALVRRAPGGDGYLVGPRMIDLGLDAITAACRTAPMRAILESLVAQVGETCNLGVLDRDRVVYVERVECDWPLRLQIGVGTRVPVHATAIGKLLLAHLPSRNRRRLLTAQPLTRFTDKTITDPDALETEFADIRRQGFAANDQENTVGLIGFAVPVRDPKGRVAAGVSLHAPSARMSVEAARAHLPAFEDTSRCLEAFIADLLAD